MTRTPHEVLDHHIEALAHADILSIVSDYAPDARFITPGGALAGKAALTEAFTGVLRQFPNFRVSAVTTVVDDEVVLLEWTAESDGHTISDGVDTFIIRDGLIHLQTAKFTPVPK